MLKHLLMSISRPTIGLASLCLVATMPLAAHAGDYSVEINKTQIMHLPAPAAAIVVGNPSIADISVHSPTLLFIVGRGYGTTNVIILDNVGNTIMNTDIQVLASKSSSSKRIYLVGEGWKSYDCKPLCQPAPVLGDEPGFIAQFKGSEQVINNTNTPITTTPYNTQSTTGTLSAFTPQNDIQYPDTFTPNNFDMVTPPIPTLSAPSPVRGDPQY